MGRGLGRGQGEGQGQGVAAAAAGTVAALPTCPLSLASVYRSLGGLYNEYKHKD